jgi:ABC-type multidrug transport system ATPase subunit
VRDRTVIVVAHRLRTVICADRIAVLEDGRLLEEGTSDELIAQNGLFARMHRIQHESLGWSVEKQERGQGYCNRGNSPKKAGPKATLWRTMPVIFCSSSLARHSGVGRNPPTAVAVGTTKHRGTAQPSS